MPLNRKKAIFLSKNDLLIAVVQTLIITHYFLYDLHKLANLDLKWKLFKFLASR